MQSILPFLPTARCGRLALLASIIIPACIVWTFWYAANSDRDDVPPFLNQLIPAGHATCRTSSIFQCASCLEPHVAHNTSDESQWYFDYNRDARNEGLPKDQCHSAFSGLFEDVNQAVAHWKSQGNITFSDLESIDIQHGMTRAMIYQGDLYIIATKSTAEDHRRKTVAVLSAMHRALAAVPDRRTIPDIEFVFSIEDKASDVTENPTQPLWVLARKATERSFFLLPDFGFWAWDNIIEGKNNEIGPYDEVVEKAMLREQSMSFQEKLPQLVWRGKLSFAPKLRRALLYASRDEEWSNVKEVNWRVKDNYLTLDEHCKYMFIAHVEGRSYSASLKYRQACRSVIVAHRMQYIQHHHYLLVSSGPHQNYVEVKRDFSDLADKMEGLVQNPREAERIADNSVKTFRERYLTPAAEACYWRALWEGYSTVSEPAKLWQQLPSGQIVKRGLRYETFILLSSIEMLDFAAYVE